MPKFVRTAAQELRPSITGIRTPGAKVLRPNQADIVDISITPNRGMMSATWQMDGSLLIFDAEITVNGDANLDVFVPRGLASFVEMQIEQEPATITGKAHLAGGRWSMTTLTSCANSMGDESEEEALASILSMPA